MQQFYQLAVMQFARNFPIVSSSFVKLQYTAIIHICGEHVVSFPLAVFDGLLHAHCILHTASNHNWQWEWLGMKLDNTRNLLADG